MSTETVVQFVLSDGSNTGSSVVRYVISAMAIQSIAIMCHFGMSFLAELLLWLSMTSMV